MKRQKPWQTGDLFESVARYADGTWPSDTYPKPSAEAMALVRAERDALQERLDTMPIDLWPQPRKDA